MEAIDDNEIVNAALDMSLEFGENWLQPIHARLCDRYPQITEKEADSLNRWCSAVRTFAFTLVEKHYSDLNGGADPGPIKAEIQRKYPMLSENNLSHLFSQGMYYAWHG